MMRLNLPDLMVALICFSVLASVVPLACQGIEAWPVYENQNYAYSIEYPRGWSVSEPFQNRQMVVIKSPDERDTLSVLVNEGKGLSLDQQVNFYINTTKQGSYRYQLISDEKVEHRGLPARQLEVVYQSQKDAPVLAVRELYLVAQGRFYLLRFATTMEDLSSLSTLYRRLFESFRLIE